MMRMQRTMQSFPCGKDTGILFGTQPMKLSPPMRTTKTANQNLKNPESKGIDGCFDC